MPRFAARDLGGSGFGAWGQAYWGNDKTHGDQDVTVFGTDFVVDRVKTKRMGIQAGVDYLFGNFVVGVTGGYERADADIRNSASDFEAKGYNVGGYAMFGGKLRLLRRPAGQARQGQPRLRQ
jgi:outer membrane autotransporter protein